jgi:hypothetical protein
VESLGGYPGLSLDENSRLSTTSMDGLDACGGDLRVLATGRDLSARPLSMSSPGDENRVTVSTESAMIVFSLMEHRRLEVTMTLGGKVGCHAGAESEIQRRYTYLPRAR